MNAEYRDAIDRLYGLWCQYHRLEPDQYQTWARFAREILS
jgi:hypothetical protein